MKQFLNIMSVMLCIHSGKTLEYSFWHEDELQYDKIEHQCSELHEAVHNRDHAKLKKLVGDGMNVDCHSDSCERTALWSASKYGFTGSVAVLADLGANVNVNERCEYNRTPLHALVDNDDASIETVGVLLHYGAQLQAVDVFGDTPLHLLAYERNIHCSENYYRAEQNARIITLLVENGVIKQSDLNQRNKRGETPYDIASDGTFKITKKAFDDCFNKGILKRPE